MDSGFAINNGSKIAVIKGTGDFVGIATNQPKEFEITERLIEPIIDPNIYKRNQREVYLISGASGAGKTTIASQIIKNYKDTFPKHNIVLFSPIVDDPAYKDLDMRQIELNEDFKDSQSWGTSDLEAEDYNDEIITIDDFYDTLVVFDDCDHIHDKRTRKIIMDIRDQLLELGRHKRCSMIVINHQLRNYALTKILLMECNKVIVFPHAGTKGQIRDYLKTYGGYSKSEIDDIFKIKSRWVLLCKTAPMYILHDKGGIIF